MVFVATSTNLLISYEIHHLDSAVVVILNPLSTKKILCKLSHWGPMDPSHQKTYEPKHLTQSIKVTLRTVKNEQFKHKNK